jgi:adhesin transport system outer membrane protein
LRHRLAISFGVAILLSLASNRPISAQALQTELQELVKSHPEILARENSVAAAREAIDKAYAGYLPKLDVLGAYGPQYIDSPLTDQNGGSAWVSQAQVLSGRLTQNLFDGFATPANVRSARLNVEVAEATLAGTRQNVLYSGIAAYIEVLRQRQLIELARDSERTIMRQLNLEDERVQRGGGIAVDVLQAKSRLQLAKERRVTFEGGLADAVARYIQVFGHPPEIDRMTPPPTPKTQLPDDLDEALEVARENNPAIESSLATVDVADERRRLARSDYYPRIDIVTSANRENDNNLVRGTSVDMSVVMQATWNLFNGFATAAGVSQASAEYQASLRNHDNVARQVTQQTRLAWNEMMTAQERVELLENAVNIASEVLEARTKLREAGRETVINVLDAENEVYNARINLVVATGDAKRAAYQVLQGVGRLELGDLRF